MMSVFKQSLPKGFTLIELMVVIALMTTILALVAPMGLNMVDKARGQTEFIQLQTLLKKYSHSSFLTASTVEIAILETSIIMSHPSYPSVQTNFDYLMFIDEDSTLTFNRNGLPSKRKINVQVGGTVKSINLETIWGEGRAP